MAAADARHPVLTQGAAAINLKKRDLALAAVAPLETIQFRALAGAVALSRCRNYLDIGLRPVCDPRVVERLTIDNEHVRAC
jgi:hypothetical protein